jgi:hypothetical protein
MLTMAFAAPEGLKNTTDENLCAILEVMYYMAKSDGVFAHEELVLFLKVAETISGGRITPGRLGILVNDWESRSSDTVEARIEEIASLLTSSYEREVTCNLAAQLAEIDDAVLAPEKNLLDFLGRSFFPQK